MERAAASLRGGRGRGGGGAARAGRSSRGSGGWGPNYHVPPNSRTAPPPPAVQQVLSDAEMARQLQQQFNAEARGGPLAPTPLPPSSAGSHFELLPPPYAATSSRTIVPDSASCRAPVPPPPSLLGYQGHAPAVTYRAVPLPPLAAAGGRGARGAAAAAAEKEQGSIGLPWHADVPAAGAQECEGEGEDELEDMLALLGVNMSDTQYCMIVRTFQCCM